MIVTRSISKAEYDAMLANCILGRTVNFPGPAAFGQFQEEELVRIMVPDGCASSWHLTLSPPAPARFSTDGQILPQPPWYEGPRIGQTKARVSWGRGGDHTSMIIDWRSGSTLNVWGSFVSLVAIVDRGAAPLALGATATPGDNGEPSQPTMTQLVGSVLAGGQIADIPIPQFAKTVLPQVLHNPAVTSNSNARLTFLDGPFSAVAEALFDTSFLAFQLQGGCQIPQPASLITYDNISSQEHVIVSLMYQLFV